MKYRSDIQILRGIAVALVVLYHLNISTIKSGFLGVDMFFVISGFLMGVLYQGKDTVGFFSEKS
ncbi:Putative lipopolysaccharide modification acyltransferase (part 1) [Vibrio diabolicus]|nr:Putative lipopolysaccharide modification acyltransferase (part 1) [Vibrio diabolicus]